MHIVAWLIFLIVAQATDALTCEPQPLCIGETCPSISRVWTSNETAIFTIHPEQTHLLIWMDDAPATEIPLPDVLQDMRILLGMTYHDATNTLILMAGSPTEFYRVTFDDEIFERIDFSEIIEGEIALCNGLYGAAFLTIGDDVIFCTSQTVDWPTTISRVYRWNQSDVELIHVQDGPMWRSIRTDLNDSLIIQDYDSALTRLDFIESDSPQIIQLETNMLDNAIGRLVGIDEVGNLYFMTTDNPPNSETNVMTKFDAEGDLVWEIETSWHGSVVEWLEEDRFLSRVWFESPSHTLWEAALCTIHP